MASQSVSNVSGSILNVENAAATLGVQPLNVRRLIAKGTLPATQMGKSNDFRVVTDDLTRYVKQGAADIELPPIKNVWFSDDDTRSAASFPNGVFKTIQGNWPTQESAEQTANENKGQTVFVYNVNGADVRDVITSPPPKGIVIPGKPPSRFSSWGEVFLANAWRSAAFKQLGMSKNVSALYSSPEVYRKTLDAAWSVVQSQQLEDKKSYSVRVGTPIMVTFKMVLPFAAIIAYVDESKLEALTF